MSASEKVDFEMSMVPMLQKNTSGSFEESVSKVLRSGSSASRGINDRSKNKSGQTILDIIKGDMMEPKRKRSVDVLKGGGTNLNLTMTASALP